MWLGWSLYIAQLNLDLPAQPVFASDEGEGWKILCEFLARKVLTPQVQIQSFAPEFWKFWVEFVRNRISR
jgi:hypothetical protein